MSGMYESTQHGPKRQKLPQVLSSSTIRNPCFSYMHLTLLSPGKTSPAEVRDVDEITARTQLTSALDQFLGLSGTAFAIDILKCKGTDVWIRVAKEDGAAVMEALNGWLGSDATWRIRSSGVWLGGLASGYGRDLFS